MNGTRRSAWTWLWVWLGAFFAFAAVAHGNFESTDAGFTMHAARALWKRGDSALLSTDQGGELLGERLGAEHIAREKINGRIGTNGRAYVWYPMGHVWLMVPFVAAGECLQQSFPGAEAAFRATVAPAVPDAALWSSPSYLYGHPVLMQGLIALLVPSMFAATSVLLLYFVARALAVSSRDAALATGSIVLGTQFFALGRETLSDGPGLCCLLGALLATVRVHLGTAARSLPLVGGMAAGASVLLRYQNAFLVVVCGLAIALACRRRKHWDELGGFLVGGLPFACLFFGVNVARFGHPLITGYPEATTWFDQPIWIGLCKLLLSAGRGILWLSPVLWLALPLAVGRRHTPQLRWLAWVLFAIPMLMFATARGWQGGQCWGARYVTPGIVVLLVLVLPQARPWVKWPRTFMLLCLAGTFANVTSVVTPTRGLIQLASQAVRAEAQHEVAALRMTEAERQAIAAEPEDVASWRPRFSPLHANWSYAWRSFPGGFEDERGAPRNGSANTIEPLFGVVAAEPVQGDAPQRWEDRGGRHLWWRFWGHLLAVPEWALVGPVALLAVLLSVLGWRRLLAASSQS